MYLVQCTFTYVCFHVKKLLESYVWAADPAAIVRPTTFCKALNVKPKLYIPSILFLSLVY